MGREAGWHGYPQHLGSLPYADIGIEESSIYSFGTETLQTGNTTSMFYMPRVMRALVQNTTPQDFYSTRWLSHMRFVIGPYIY